MGTLRPREMIDEDADDGDDLPIPLQIFLWRQSAPFLRPRLGRAHDTSCMFCQRAPGHHELKESCKSFEKVLVQNIRQGLSASLSDAIQSIPRWRMIQAALPHVMHSLAAMLHNRVKDNMVSLGNVETKLLYTLHWILLDASDECADADYENGLYYTHPFHYLFSIPTVTLFVYLFAPLSQYLRESDFSNYRLENGLKIWGSMWEFRHPDAPCFTTRVKPQPRPLGNRPHGKPQPTDVFLGRKFSKEEAGSQSPPVQQMHSPDHTRLGPDGWVSSPKDTIFPETIPEESSSIEDDHFVGRFGAEQPETIVQIEACPIYLADPSVFRFKTEMLKQLPNVSNLSSSERESLMDIAGASGGQKWTPPQEKSSPLKSNNVSAATFLDVATLRCLFATQWQEEGVYWALHYLYNRLRDISEDMTRQWQPRKRSNSLPIPKIEVSFYQSPEMKKRESLKNFIEIPEPKEITPVTETSPPQEEGREKNLMFRRASEKVKKKMKMYDLRAFVETKLLSKSEKALEKIGNEEKFQFNTAEHHRSLEGSERTALTGTPPRSPPAPPAARPDSTSLLQGNLVKGKSMPSLRYIGEVKPERSHELSMQSQIMGSKKINPIITVTEHTPTPSPDYMSKTRHGSLESQIDSVSMQGSQHLPTPERKPSLTRSQTDSNITYIVEEVQEAAGSMHYITKDGDMDIHVVLKAVYSVSTMDSNYLTLRVMEVMLNIVDTLIEMGILDDRDDNDRQAQSNTDSKNDTSNERYKSQESTNESGENVKEKPKEEDFSNCPYYMIIQVVFRVSAMVGCERCGAGSGAGGGAGGAGWAGGGGAGAGMAGDMLRSLALRALQQARERGRPGAVRAARAARAALSSRRLLPALLALHALTAFCCDAPPTPAPAPAPNQHAAHQTSNNNAHDGQKRSSNKYTDIPSLRAAYANNFGENKSGSNENWVLGVCSGLMVARLAAVLPKLPAAEQAKVSLEARLLVSHLRGALGGSLRRVACAGLLRAAARPAPRPRDPRPHRPNQQNNEEDRGSETGVDSGVASDDKYYKKFAFKRRSVSSSGVYSVISAGAGGAGAGGVGGAGAGAGAEVASDSGSWSPRVTPPHAARLRARTVPAPPAPALHHIVQWLRGRGRGGARRSRGGGAGAGARDWPPPLVVHPHPHPPATVRRRVGHTLYRAKKRVEDRLYRFGFRKMGKKRDGSIEDTLGGSSGWGGSSSADGGAGVGSGGGAGSECGAGLGQAARGVGAAGGGRRVSLGALRGGLAGFSLLLGAAQPGALPDPLAAAALLDLPFTVVVARAAYILEMAHLVHNCNKGHWPAWLRAPPNTFKPPITQLSPQLKRQRLAGKLFHQWAEMIGNRLEEMLETDRKCIENVDLLVQDPEGQRALLRQDLEEDYLDEENMRLPGKPIGHDCPRALRLVACVLLFEITAFLRETYQNLPKNTRSSLKEKGPWERVYREANRRWSMALSSMGHSQASAQSLQSIVCEPERKISFALHEPEAASGSNNALIEAAATADKNRAAAARGKTRRGYGSFKRRSIKLRQKDSNEDYANKRSDSIQSRRKVSTLSDRSDTSEQAAYTGLGVSGGGGDESGGEAEGGDGEAGGDGDVEETDEPPDSPDSNSTDTPAATNAYPWLQTIVRFMSSFNYTCRHEGFCHPYCFRRNMRGCARLLNAVQKVYGEKSSPEIPSTTEEDSSGVKKRSRSRKSSEADRKDSMSRDPKTWIDKDSVSFPPRPPSPTPDPPPILKYLKTQVRDGHHSPLAALLKGAIVLPEDVLSSASRVAWELLLENDREISTCAAALFIVAAVRTPHSASDILQRYLTHDDPQLRINASLRFQVMWKLRYQVWCRLEEGAAATLKVPPPGIEFTLPSPKIGIEALAVVDPPWEPHGKDKDMEMTLNKEKHRSLVTATKTRKKQQTEAIKKAQQERNDKKKAERESFLLTSVPILREAGREAVLEHITDDHIEASGEEEGEGGRAAGAGGGGGAHHGLLSAAALGAGAALFPAALCGAAPALLALLHDARVAPAPPAAAAVAVYEVAYQVIWNCLVEDSALFLRHVLERLTRGNQDHMFKSLRHLIRFIPRLPHQAAFALYNYIIGYVMFYVRTPHEDGLKLIGSALSILWMVVHSVHGLMFKDLKQILRKEQCDAALLLTANVPAAKKIVVHGPDNDGSIPSQFPVQEDTQFCQILRESLDFFGIPEHLHDEHFLVDYKTRQIQSGQWYVRDQYFFKRAAHGQLALVRLGAGEARRLLQRRELAHKAHEIGKVLLTWAILKNVDQVVQRVVFLHEELLKLPSFPRKALEASLELHAHPPLGATLRGLDVLHKFMWVRLIARMFEAMAGNFTSSRDIHLFLNVLNGALMLHSEDSLILRYVIATYVNSAFNFKNIFSTNGYLLIMPTLLQIYSNYQTNKLVTTTIEYAVKQFYLLNRKPFILQMFGSVSAILDTDEESAFGDASKVQSSCLFNLLLSLETPSPDPLHIAELIKEEKPLRPIDFCYRDEDEMVNVLDCISLCVMVVSYSAESVRGYQMLVILEAILPCYVKQIQLPTYNREGRTEKEIIQQLAIAIKTLVNNCEGLSKSYNGPYSKSPEHLGSSQRGAGAGVGGGGVGGSASRGPASFLPLDLLDEDSRLPSEAPRPQMHLADSELVRAEYRRPRDVLLSLVGGFVGSAGARLLELHAGKGSSGSGGEGDNSSAEGKPIELLDNKSHIRLADIAHSLLKVSPYDPESMGCRGLQRYVTQVLPSASWGDIALRPALTTILRRLDKVFLKIAKKPSIRKNTDWDAAAVLLKGVYETMVRCPFIMHWQQFKTLLSTVQNLIVSESGGEALSSATAAVLSQPPPPHFCSTVVRLLALHLTTEGCSLEQMCGGTSVFPTVEKTENMLMNLFMPLCLRVGSGRKDVPPLRAADISYIVSVVLHALCPPAGGGGGGGGGKLGDARANSLTFTGSRDTRRCAALSDRTYCLAFTALKVVCACFPNELCNEWGRISRCVRELSRRNEASRHVCAFLQHVVQHRAPLYVLLLPAILQKVRSSCIGAGERALQAAVLAPAAPPPARAILLGALARDLRALHQEQFLDSTRIISHGKRPSEAVVVKAGGAGGAGVGEHRHRQSLVSLFAWTKPRTPDLPHHSHASQRESLSSGSAEMMENRRLSDVNSIYNTNTPTGSNSKEKEETSLSEQNNSYLQSKLRFGSSVEVKLNSEAASSTPLSPLSPGGGGSGGGDSADGERPRLQRAQGPSKRTFKCKRKQNTIELSTMSVDPGSPPAPPALPPGDSSWDSCSQHSQTSSTCGYRDSLLISALESEGGSSAASPQRLDDAESLSCDSASSAERTALLGTSSQRTLVFGSDVRDEENTLL